VATREQNSVLLFSGGVGGAKLAVGLSGILEPNELSIVVNTADDEEIYGLHISPDIDTVLYSIADIVNKETGWGINNDTFTTLESFALLGEETWFRIGDIDFLTHIKRTKMLVDGYSLSDVTDFFTKKFKIPNKIIPMTDGNVRTVLQTDKGELKFQEYFVREKCKPIVHSIEYEGALNSNISKGFIDELNTSKSLIIGPSNPLLSINPILSIPKARDLFLKFDGLRIAVSPIVNNYAIRGPLAKIMSELGVVPSCTEIAKYYKDICDIFVIDSSDSLNRRGIENLGMDVFVTDIIMNNDESKKILAEKLMNYLK
tara:strand:- start:2870 stop:3814 length:945 start_codon:yes stop_codon:yes gene_type:complete